MSARGAVGSAPRARDHGAMSPSPDAVRLMLVERRDTVAPPAPGAAKVRRYRLARLQVSPRADARARFEYLRRSYD
jgi:hypothetical protein